MGLKQRMKETAINVPLPQELAEKVEQEAQRRLTSKASIIREALLAYFAAKANREN